MSGNQVAWLGAIAGFTIFLGLPIGRAKARLVTTKAVLNAVAVGILIFLLWDVLAHAWEPIDVAVADHHLGVASADGLVLAVGLAVGLIGLVWFDRWMARRARPTTPAATTATTTGDATNAATGDGAHSARRLALLIAIGIGLHNFAEGLAIGNSAAAGEISLAWLLVIGFATHNATEGFGIIAPLSAEGVRPSWRQLLGLGLIGGAPTLIGTLVGQQTTAELASIAFLALAAGSILYVVIELLAVLRRYAVKYVTTWGLFIGLMLGFLTDAVLVAAGA
jgi:ZIP family zinc transporter